MSRLTENYFAEVERLAVSYLELRRLSPEHEYLKFATFRDDDTVFVADDFLKTYEPKDWPVRRSELLFRVQTLRSANQALEEAVRMVA